MTLWDNPVTWLKAPQDLMRKVLQHHAWKEAVPCKQDVVSVIGVQPRREDWEGLAALTEGRLEAEAAQTRGCGGHTRLSAIAMVHINV